MRVEKMGRMVLSFLIMGLLLQAGEDNSQKKEVKNHEGKSLIKKELLIKKKRVLTPPRRNIFSSWNSGRESIEEEAEGEKNNPHMFAEITQQELSSLDLNLRYVGYVISEEKIVALVIFRGNVLAVESGEMIDVGVKVIKILPEEIEVVGPDSKNRTFSLEGEMK